MSAYLYVISAGDIYPLLSMIAVVPAYKAFVFIRQIVGRA